MSKAPAVPKKTKAPEWNDSAAVDAFLARLEHAHKTALQALRRLILDADPSITEGLKWNSPSFYRGGWFATMQLRAKAGIQVIFHLGAKVRPGVDARAAIADPAGLLQWLGPDRASLVLRDEAELRAQSHALAEVVRRWIAVSGA